MKTVVKDGTVIKALVCQGQGLSAPQPFYSKMLQQYTSYNVTSAIFVGWHRLGVLLMVVMLFRLSMYG